MVLARFAAPTSDSIDDHLQFVSLWSFWLVEQNVPSMIISSVFSVSFESACSFCWLAEHRFLLEHNIEATSWMVCDGVRFYMQDFHIKLICLANQPRLNFVLIGNMMLMHKINENLVNEQLYMLLSICES
jgi:hypothetical protein